MQKIKNGVNLVGVHTHTHTHTHTGDFRKSMYKINRDSKFKLVLLIGIG